MEDVLPRDFLSAIYNLVSHQIELVGKPDFKESYTPYGIRNLNAFVSLGRFDDAFRLLSAALIWRRPSGWRSWAEVVWGEPQSPEYIGDMPHTWIGAEFVTAIRRMLLRENGDALELLRAVPDGWWESDGITLHELPTAFGIANLRARRDQAQAIVDLKLSGPEPKRITCRYPGAKQARADGRLCNVHGDVISAPSFNRLVIDS